MNLVTLKSFLCCMTLETGGLVISIFHLVIQAVLMIIGILFLTIFDCHDFQLLISEEEYRICLFERDFIAFNLLLIIISISMAIIPYWCIKAIKNRNHTGIIPFMWFLGAIAVCAMYDLVFFSLEGLALALIKGSVNLYFLYVVYSLYVMLRDEPRRKVLTGENEPLSILKKNSKTNF